MTRDAFHRFLTDPRTSTRLDGMLADNARVDAQLARGPHACCGEFGSVIVCDGEFDVWACPVCDTTWTAECR